MRPRPLLVLVLLVVHLQGCATLGGVPLSVRNATSERVEGTLTLLDAQGEAVGEPFAFSLDAYATERVTRLARGEAADARVALADGRTAQPHVGFTRDVRAVDIVIGNESIHVAPHVH